MSVRGRCVGSVVVLILVARPAPGEAQLRPGPTDEIWPVLDSGVQSADPVTADQVGRLPVYDDDGELIPYREIQELVDPSGSSGAFWGALLGGSVGAGAGALMTRCGEVRGGYQYYCSPREEALRSRVPVGLAVTLGLLGAWIGYETDRVTFDEAVAEIRLQRGRGR